MTCSRRDFSSCLVAAGLGSVLPGVAGAQPAPAEGVNYVRLADPAPVAPGGKIEVIEFFWYECPHCNAFEPALEGWTRKLPADVAFRRVPVWFREEPFSTQQRLFYALEALDLLPTLHRKVFQAIHVERVRMRTPEDLAAFALKNGVDPVKFIAAYNAFSVQSKSMQARQTASAYKIDSVPAMGVHGRYYTNGSLANTGLPAGSNDRMLVVVDALVAKVRQGVRA
ncbi:MAG TPA: thiol:disulfide interchange protein DsbA/DsbL [Caldimonas sp.]|nr:thiol:disulfide interchange protein DsbA/DsbL [Caldimonas sp.]